MKKIAVFVEGQTELITVRELVLKTFSWKVNVQCLELHSQSFKEVPYQYDNPEADIYYQIVNIGNDKRVMSAILEREQSLWTAGFDKLIGLRDMYSKEYREKVAPSKSISQVVNGEFIQAKDDLLAHKAIRPNRIRVCFSIMEIEAWFLCMYKFLERLNPALNSVGITNSIGDNIETIDPEVTFFHPSNVLATVFALGGDSYKKRESNIEAILSQLQNDDFEELYSSEKCNSFNVFYDELLSV
jgi:hypothetical protein